ncbi:hypothetical protein ABZ769_37000 [Streptomyces olivoreticuli]
MGDVFISGAGPEVSLGGKLAYWDDECQYMWHKERLVNLAVSRLPEYYTHVVWCDNDVLIEEGWKEAVNAAFNEAPAVRCYQTARYLNASGSCSKTLKVDNEDGFVWGAARSFFTDGPGLFELGLVGGGDSFFRAGIMRNPLVMRLWSHTLRRISGDWLDGVGRWVGNQIPSAARTHIEIIGHGPPKARQYLGRHRLLGDLDPDKHLLMDEGKIFRWSQAGFAQIEPKIRSYFHDRREDDPG